MFTPPSSHSRAGTRTDACALRSVPPIPAYRLDSSLPSRAPTQPGRGARLIGELWTDPTPAAPGKTSFSSGVGTRAQGAAQDHAHLRPQPCQDAGPSTHSPLRSRAGKGVGGRGRGGTQSPGALCCPPAHLSARSLAGGFPPPQTGPSSVKGSRQGLGPLIVGSKSP